MIVRDPSPLPSASPSASPSTSPSPSPATAPSVEEVLVSGLYEQLSAAAVNLNAASDELGKCVTALDTSIKILNLGISTWVRVAGDEDEFLNYWIHDLGYARVDGRWGIALRTERGNEADPGHATGESWLFNDAPRELRIEAVDRIPELLAALIKEATTTSAKIREKTAQLRQLASAIKQAASDKAAPKRK